MLELGETFENLGQLFDLMAKNISMFILKNSELESCSLINNIFKTVFATMTRYILNKLSFYIKIMWGRSSLVL